MKRNHIYRYSMLAALLAVVTIIACEKQLDKTNPSYPTLDTYFQNADELQRGTNAIYSSMHSGQLVAREWFFVHDLRSDDVAPGGSQLELPRGQILAGNTSPDNSVMNDMWEGLYTVIHRANTVIFYSSRVTDNTALRDRCVAEAKFFRGWAYFELVSLWGPVPIYDKPVTLANEFQPRQSEENVYNQIIKDLEEAAAVLPPTYEAADRGRATWGAAKAMLGRVNMQKGDYGKAKAALQDIVNKNMYSLVPRYLDNFEEENEFNQESIWEAVFFETSPNQFNWSGSNGPTGDDPSAPQGTTRNQEISPIAWRNLIPNGKYLEEFEVPANTPGLTKEDPRLQWSVYRPGDTFNNGTLTITETNQNGNASLVRGTPVKASWRKYTLIYKHGIQDRAGGGINHRMIRYAEVLLMLAECENETAQDGGLAVKYLNDVRLRAQMPLYPTAKYPVTGKDDRTKAIIHEKRVEMGGEQVRNRDILRWRKKGYIPALVPEPFNYFNPNRDAVLPIPQQEIDNNPILGTSAIPKQNANY
jgi:starch-binding outer membrane protein, SusD/RagB family